MKSTSSAALFAAVGLLALGAGVPAATAADLGGDCCADLEERVAELEATTARKGNRRTSLTISGQVTTALMAWNDGDESDVYVVDNTHAGGTFFSFSGNAKINPNVSAGFNITLGMCAGARSHHVNADDDDAQQNTGGGALEPICPSGAGDSTMVLTLANWYLDHKQLGRVTVGRINTATAGISVIDLGGAGVIAGSNTGYWMRGFKDPESGQSWATILGGNTINGASLSRANAISYSSPTFGGFSVAAAWGEDNVWDVALRYAGEFSGFRVAAGIGYVNNQAGLNEIFKDDSGLDEPSQIKGSASILHVASGLYLTGAYVDQDAGDSSTASNATLWYLQGGISKNWTGLGNTVVYGEWAQIDDAKLAAPVAGQLADATVWGIGVVQHVDAAAMELFLAYRNYSAESDVEDFGDFDVVMGGARIRF